MNVSLASDERKTSFYVKLKKKKKELGPYRGRHIVFPSQRIDTVVRNPKFQECCNWSSSMALYYLHLHEPKWIRLFL